MVRVQKMFTLKSRTKQSFKKECDVNEILKKFKKVAGKDLLASVEGYANGRYGDFSQVVDYRTALDQVRAADEVFMALPAIVRKRFDNDAATFMDFCQNPKNQKELVEMGLATKRAPIENTPSPTPSKPSTEKSG